MGHSCLLFITAGKTGSAWHILLLLSGEVSFHNCIVRKELVRFPCDSSAVWDMSFEGFWTRFVYLRITCSFQVLISLVHNHLVGLVVKVSASIAEDPGFKSRLRQDFFRVKSYRDLKIGTPVATLPGAWCYRISAGTGRPGVSILWLGEVESLICNFCLKCGSM